MDRRNVSIQQRFHKKNYNEESDEGYFLAVDAKYPKKLYEPHNDLPFLPKRKKLTNL